MHISLSLIGYLGSKVIAVCAETMKPHKYNK